ncbi:hypothetical protein QBC47DRAFT_23602 [Echria macrotheca]|uniref:Uncharacterized protein n=1 Tax=Echria macrotheca TaxID=438768 RepID=A0AAJ0BSH2_9PEZI|nr:hypothetical protein QBC47DRAFT_23602 [Echria macrotheca]
MAQFISRIKLRTNGRRSAFLNGLVSRRCRRGPMGWFPAVFIFLQSHLALQRFGQQIHACPKLPHLHGLSGTSPPLVGTNPSGLDLLLLPHRPRWVSSLDHMPLYLISWPCFSLFLFLPILSMFLVLDWYIVEESRFPARGQEKNPTRNTTVRSFIHAFGRRLVSYLVNTVVVLPSRSVFYMTRSRLRIADTPTSTYT